MKSGETGVVILEHDIEMSNVSEVIITLSSVAGEIEKRLSQNEVEIKPNNKILIPLSQDDTIRLSRKTDTEVKVEGQIVFNDNPPTVCKTEIVSFKLGATLRTEHVAGANGAEGQYNAVSIRCHAGVIYANVDPGNVEALVEEKLTEALANNEVINGKDGKDGRDGVDGADGKSAYEIAVENGFEGTEAQWLDSLKGPAGEGTSNSEDYPAYARAEKESILAQLQQYYNVENPIVIGFSTDQHLQDIQPEVEENVIPNLRTLRDLTKEFPFDLCVLGGDASSTDTNVPLLNADVLNVSNALDGANCPVIHLVGNHDGRGNIPTIKASAVFGAHRTNALKDNVAITTDESTNCYYDDKAKKIRFIFIISIDLNGYANAKGKAFLLSALENMPNDYEAIIFSHHPMGNLTDDPSTRFDDWNEPLGWGNDLAPYSDKIIACICGHVHDDRHEIKDGILYLSSTCAGFRELNDGTTRTDKLGTVNCTAYDVFVIDRATYTIHCIRYGIGENRDIVYHVPSYTNVIPTSQDEEGNVYNEIGYKVGARLESTGAETSGNGTITGFIPVKDGDIIRLKNCKLNGTSNVYTDRLALYGANHNCFNCQYPVRFIETSSSNLNIVLDSDGFVEQFTISGAVKYFRISSSAMDENSVITINEEIN